MADRQQQDYGFARNVALRLARMRGKEDPLEFLGIANEGDPNWPAYAGAEAISHPSSWQATRYLRPYAPMSDEELAGGAVIPPDVDAKTAIEQTEAGINDLVGGRGRHFQHGIAMAIASQLLRQAMGNVKHGAMESIPEMPGFVSRMASKLAPRPTEERWF